MENIESPSNEIEQLFDKVESYTRTTIELVRLKSMDITSQVVTTMVAKLAVVITLSIFALVLNIGIAIYLGELLGQPYYGYFIVAVFYLVASIVLYYFLHGWIKKSIGQSILKQAQQ